MMVVPNVSGSALRSRPNGFDSSCGGHVDVPRLADDEPHEFERPLVVRWVGRLADGDGRTTCLTSIVLQWFERTSDRLPWSRYQSGVPHCSR
jgi:hypothetical protein